MQIDAFTTGQSSPAHAVRGWRDATHRLFYHSFVTTPRGAEPFRGNLRIYASQRHKFATVNLSSHVCTCRPPASVRAKPYLLNVFTGGGALVEQDGRTAVLNKGDIVLVDTSRPLSIETSHLETVSVDVSAAQMRAILPDVDRFTAMSISSETSAGAILAAALGELVELPSRMDDEVIDHIADAIPHLVAAALAALPATKETASRRSDAHHLQRVRAFVRSRLRDRDLSPETIARAVYLSPRYLHQLFADQPLTLMRWIWSQRLERCRDELATPSLRHRSISEIAYGWAFSDIAHFSRAFRRQFGQSPLAFREQTLQADSRQASKSTPAA